MKTLLLDRAVWDLVLNASGSIAVASQPYAIAQNVASAVKTFNKDCWYDQHKGLPYFEQILGKFPPLSKVRWLLEQTALTQQGVVAASARRIQVGNNRGLTGAVMVTDQAGNTQRASF